MASLQVSRFHRFLLDLGVSSMQLDQPERGFAFSQCGPLDSRMGRDSERGMTVREALVHMSEEQLSEVLWQFGEERLHRSVARQIKQALRDGQLETTVDLRAVCERAYRHHARKVRENASSCSGSNRFQYPRKGRIDPATRTFQALRMFVNQELTELSRVLDAMPFAAAPGARLAVISFHSLEARAVKERMKYVQTED